LGTSVLLILRKKIALYATRAGECEPYRTAVLTVLAGAVVAVLFSISSVGAGAIGVPAPVPLYFPGSSRENHIPSRWMPERSRRANECIITTLPIATR
jgi:hypothetical protein